ncbi:MAG: leucine-rich repeat domain-containing protein [Clostridia bacterium]|nr:leucine-rich repeat domain-containing protein [Clostridia bacterium]
MTDLIYEIDTSKYEIKITGVSDKSKKELVIPDEIDGMAVTEISKSAFENYEELTSVTIPSSVTSIDSYTFVTCKKLSAIIVKENNRTYKSIDGNLYSKDGKTLIRYAIGKKDTSFKIPNDVTALAHFAFANCANLKSITMPNSITSIGAYAFSRCTGISRIVVPRGVTTIGKLAFDHFIGLESVKIPSSVTCIDHFAFANCPSLKSVNIPRSITNIGHFAFIHCLSLKNVTIPKSVTSIGKETFKGCTSLTIHAQVKSKPDGWIPNWNPANRPVVWGYKKWFGQGKNTK